MKAGERAMSRALGVRERYLWICKILFLEHWGCERTLGTRSGRSS